MNSTTLTDIISRYAEPQNGFFSLKVAKSWPQGLLIGNGSLGAVVMGQPQKECLIVCHEELFLPLFDRLPVLNMAEFLPDIRALIEAGKYEETMDLVVEKAVEAGYPPDYVMTDPSHPAFDLLLDFGSYADISQYRRSVDFSTGEATVQYTTCDAGPTLRRSFASRRDGVIISEILSTDPISMAVHLGTRPYDLEVWESGQTSPGYITKGQFYQRGIRSVETRVDGNDIVYRSAYANTDGGYEGVARVIAVGGKIVANGNGLRVIDAESVMVLCTAVPLKEYNRSTIADLKRELDELDLGYDVLLERHTAIHADLFNRITLDLHDETSRKISLENHIQRAQNTAPSAGYMELLFDACRYIIISSTGKLPPNLQGVWSATWTPHWSGDYTLDANVQAAVAHMLSCGTPELMESLFSLMDRFMPDFRENARRLYNADGIFLNSRVSTTGLQQRYNRCPVYFWTAGAGWIAHYYWDYFLHTRDEKFLRERAMPFMNETAAFYESFLIENDEGRFLFSPSWSPENHAANTGSPVAINATMDIAVCKELFTNLISTCQILNIDVDRIPHYKQIVEKLPAYITNGDGALQEWSSPNLEDRYSHRHMSHLYPLYPGSEVDPGSTSALYSAARKAVAKRLEYYDPSDYGAFGLYHASIAASRSGDAAHAWDALAYLARYHVYSGGATAHNPGPEIFNVDMAGGFPAAVVELLVSVSVNRIALLPAVPTEWNTGSIHGIRCPGQIVIEQLSWNTDDCTVSLEIVCAVEHESVIILPDGSQNQLALKAGELRSVEYLWDI